jgi:hypothetical protein
MAHYLLQSWRMAIYYLVKPLVAFAPAEAFYHRLGITLVCFQGRLK